MSINQRLVRIETHFASLPVNGTAPNPVRHFFPDVDDDVYLEALQSLFDTMPLKYQQLVWDDWHDWARGEKVERNRLTSELALSAWRKATGRADRVLSFPAEVCAIYMAASDRAKYDGVLDHDCQDCGFRVPGLLERITNPDGSKSSRRRADIKTCPLCGGRVAFAQYFRCGG